MSVAVSHLATLDSGLPMAAGVATAVIVGSGTLAAIRGLAGSRRVHRAGTFVTLVGCALVSTAAGFAMFTFSRSEQQTTTPVDLSARALPPIARDQAVVTKHPSPVTKTSTYRVVKAAVAFQSGAPDKAPGATRVQRATKRSPVAKPSVPAQRSNIHGRVLQLTAISQDLKAEAAAALAARLGRLPDDPPLDPVPASPGATTSPTQTTTAPGQTTTPTITWPAGTEDPNNSNTG